MGSACYQADKGETELAHKMGGVATDFQDLNVLQLRLTQSGQGRRFDKLPLDIQQMIASWETKKEV